MKQQTAGRTVQVHSHIPADLRSDLAALAADNDRSLAAEIRRALAEHVRAERPQER